MTRKGKVKVFIAAFITCGALAIARHVDAQSIRFAKPPVINYDDYDIKDNPVFATYDTGKIYITKQSTSIEENLGDIIILDMRDEKENMQIVSSYRIVDGKTQLEIIDILLVYNELYPSRIPWIRSRESLFNEWLIHNIAYYLNYKRDHSDNVDFQNNEERRYSPFKLIKK